MIGCLEGKVLRITPEPCLILVQGVGYKVHFSHRVQSEFILGQEVRVWIEPIGRDNQLDLFGFLDPEEQLWFTWLVHVPGVGGRVAQHILSTLPPWKLQQAIMTEQLLALKSAEGVGSKLAHRIMSELKAKALHWKRTTEENGEDHTSSRENQDALLALCALGYGLQEAQQALLKVKKIKPHAEFQEVVRESLRCLSQTLP